MDDPCAIVINGLIRPSVNIKEQLISLINDTELQIMQLKDTIFFTGETESLLSMYSEGEHFLKEVENTHSSLVRLESNISSSLQGGRELAEKYTPHVLEIESMQSAIEASKQEEILSFHRSELSAARVIGSLDIALSAFSNLSMNIGTHIQSKCSVTLPLPHFYQSNLKYFIDMFQETLGRMELPKIKPLKNWTESGIERLTDRCPWDDELVNKFCCLYRTLSVIKLPNDFKESEATKRVRLALPMRLILEPLEKRFLFNFYGNRITNNPEHPEWYFTEVLTWISLNDQWLTWMQDEQLKDLTDPLSSLRVCFMQGLTSFLIDKMSFDLGLLSHPPKPRCPIQIKDKRNEDQEAGSSPLESTTPRLKERLLTSAPPPALLGRLTDEMLAFEERLDGLCYPPEGAIRPADLFTHRLDVLHHWLALESRLAHRKLCDLLSKESTWSLDSNKLPQCVGDLQALVYSISRRVAHLHQRSAVKSRLFFSKVQLDLLWTFATALLVALPWNRAKAEKSASTLPKPPSAPWTSLLNALQAVLEIMQEWNNDQYFVELWEDQECRRMLTSSWDLWMDEQSTNADSETETWISITQRLENALADGTSAKSPSSSGGTLNPGVFSQMCDYYSQQIESSLRRLGDSLYECLCDLAQPYLADGQQWSRVDSLSGDSDSAVVTGLSGMASSLFVRLNSDLSATSNALLPPLFTALWQPVILRIDRLFYQKLVLGNRFTSTGARQLNYDIATCLRGLLMSHAPLSATVDDLLAESLDACRLLVLPAGVSQLLRQSLGDADSRTVVLTTFLELGIRKLTPEDALTVLSRLV